MVSLCVYTLDYGLAERGCSKRKYFSLWQGFDRIRLFKHTIE